jgi:UDP-N-acetyl-D-mannosaminuronic acid dehydrogenase
VAVLGYAYLENSDDTRNSPSAELVGLLSKRGFQIAVHDPFVRDYEGEVIDVLRNADCAVLMVAHKAYRDLDLKAAAQVMRTRALVDARGFFDVEALREAGFAHKVIGVADRAAAYEDAAGPK